MTKMFYKNLMRIPVSSYLELSLSMEFLNRMSRLPHCINTIDILVFAVDEKSIYFNASSSGTYALYTISSSFMRS